MTILEAMACGTPVLSSNRGSLPEVVGDAGLLFDPDDSEALPSLILEVIRNPLLRQDLVKRGFDRAREYSWERTSEGILRSCNRVLGEKM